MSCFKKVELKTKYAFWIIQINELKQRITIAFFNYPQ
jgi:hypothetical protein